MPAAAEAPQTAHEVSREAKAGVSRASVSAARKSTSDSSKRMAASTGSPLAAETK